VMSYVFYRVLKLYTRMQEKDPVMMASGIASALLSCNLLALLMLALAFTSPSVRLNFWLVLLGMVFIHAGSHYYFVKRQEQYEARWSHDSHDMKRIKGGLIVLYIILTGAALIYFYILLNEARKGNFLSYN
jgi:hypothetical protein